VAESRCNKFSERAVDEFNKQIGAESHYWERVKAGRVVDGLGAIMKKWRKDALGQFSAFSFCVF
jgi:hypothetical protein